MKKIIGLIGYARAGKDTIASYYPEYHRVSFADELKKECQIMLEALGKKADIIGNDQDKCFYRRGYGCRVYY